MSHVHERHLPSPRLNQYHSGTTRRLFNSTILPQSRDHIIQGIKRSRTRFADPGLIIVSLIYEHYRAKCSCRPREKVDIRSHRRGAKLNKKQVGRLLGDPPTIGTMSPERKPLEWLDGLDCAAKQDVTLSLRQPDTCE